ncbi:hypothetical protein LTR53_013044 [Teratosphaeriaceae sp. CCFEE 6253]|nr:hypothetical protein LTR53_013044 [Teratosphaeriaceae sp. CCFEE 6253]
MEIISPPPTPQDPPAQKLHVIRFLDVHLAEGGIERRSYDVLYRMIMVVSALGREVYGVMQDPVADASGLSYIEWYCTCLLEGCEAFRKYMRLQAEKAQRAAETLCELGAVSEQDLDGPMGTWREALHTLHVPTGNDAKLFRHIITHYNASVYWDFLEFNRDDPESVICAVGQQLTAIKQLLNEIESLCDDADGLVENLEAEYGAASYRLELWTEQNVQPPVIVEPVPVRPKLRIDVYAATHAALKTSPIPDEPPRLPPLPFQKASMPDLLVPAKSAPVDGVGDRGLLSITKSFSAVEDQVGHRKHFRSATMANTGYISASSGSDQILRPKMSMSAIPRVFTSSFSELETGLQRLKLHEAKTADAQPSPPMPDSPTEEDMVHVRGFGGTSNASSVYPSPVTLLYRREALVSKDAHWGSRIVNGELVRSRRPSERLPLQQVREHSGDLEEWLNRSSRAEHSNPDTPNPLVKRGMLRQRENTL